MAQALRLPERSPLRCRVCGCDPVTSDVVDPGAGLAELRLCECPRCDHRWTERIGELSAPVAARATLRVLREGASAA